MEDNNKICHNCEAKIHAGDKFCGRCGQKADTNLLSFSELLMNFWHSIFNVDSTLFKSLKYIWTPWKLTSFYVEGKRKSFLNPMRLFLITLLFHFGYLVSVTNIDNNFLKSNSEYKKLEKSLLYEKYLTIKCQMPEDKSIKVLTDSLESSLFKGTKTPEADTFKIENLFNLNEFPITRQDAIELPIDSVYAKYHVASFFDKLMVKQMIRLNLDREGVLRYAIGNAAWGVLVVITLLAALFKLLYYRKKMKYVEHLVFLMNVHSLCFIFNTVSLFTYYTLFHGQVSEKLIGSMLIFFSPVCLFISMFYNFRQGFFKTLLKYIFTSGVYLILGFTIIFMVSIGSIIFF